MGDTLRSCGCSNLPSARASSRSATIHHATLEILETVGVRVAHDEALQLLRDRGCRIKGEDIVLIPNWLVEQAIRRAPSAVTIYNRIGQEAMRLEGRNNYYGLGTDLIRTQDVRTGAIRPSVLQDVINAARVSDACPNIDFIASFALPGDVPTNIMYVACVKAQTGELGQADLLHRGRPRGHLRSSMRWPPRLRAARKRSGRGPS